MRSNDAKKLAIVVGNEIIATIQLLAVESIFSILILPKLSDWKEFGFGGKYVPETAFWFIEPKNN